MARSKKIDMTTGPIMKNVFLFAIPIVLGSILQQLYTTVDTLVVGNYCGSESLAAIGTSTQPIEVLLCLFLGIGSGVSILASHYIGARDEERLQKLSGTAVFFIYGAGIPMSLVGYLATPLILRLMQVPEDAWIPAVTYTRIYFLGTLGNIGYNLNAGMLRGLGDSKASLWFLVVSCITNVVLDLLFVAGFHLGIGGAAISTIIAMFLSWFVSIRYIQLRYPQLGYTFLPRRFSKKELGEILRIGLPIGFNSSFYSFGHMALQTMVNLQGSAFMAGCSISGRITSISNLAINSMTQAAATFAGQNYGAKNYQRLKDGHLRIPFTSGAITLAFGLFFCLLRMPILRLFSKDEMVLMYASRYVVVLLLCQWVFAIFNCILSIANGIGQVKYTMAVNLMMLWAVRVPVAAAINKYFDGTYIMLSYPVSFTFGLICMLFFYVFSKKWKEIIKNAH